MEGIYTNETAKLMNEVASGNPGAYSVAVQLQYFSHWWEMMIWLKRNDYTGSKLWELYKDEFKCNWYNLGRWVENEYYKDRESKNKLYIPKCDFGLEFEG